MKNDLVSSDIRYFASAVCHLRRGANQLGLAMIALALLLPTGCATNSRSANNSQTSNDRMPVFFDGATILFQGDSITDGNRGGNLDPNPILGHGYQFIIAAKYGDELAGQNLNFLNRAISGNTVSALARRWQKDTLDLKPDREKKTDGS